MSLDVGAVTDDQWPLTTAEVRDIARRTYDLEQIRQLRDLLASFDDAEDKP